MNEELYRAFGTTFPDGTVTAGFIDARGKQIVFPGVIDPEIFADAANHLIQKSMVAGLLQDDTKLFGHTVLSAHVLHTEARVELDENDELVLDWNVGLDENRVPTSDRAGIVPITMVEV